MPNYRQATKAIAGPVFNDLDDVLEAMDRRRGGSEEYDDGEDDADSNETDDSYYDVESEEEYDLEILEEFDGEDQRVNEIYRANIVDSTRDGYRRSMRRFAVWIFQQYRVTGQRKYRDLMHDDLYTILYLHRSDETGAVSPKKTLYMYAKPVMERASPSFLPINLSLLTVNDFIKFLLSMTENGKFLSKSAYGSHRAALNDLFRECKVRQSEEFIADLEKSFSGLKRKAQIYKAEDGGKLGEGKKPLPFKLYQLLCEWMIHDGSKESTFAWCFLTLTWNLICRSKNTVNIHRSHIAWENDSMVIQFAHMKTDMMGFEEAVKRHIYANPSNPIICPVLALGVYLGTVGPSASSGKLFAGKAQYDRFRKYLVAIVAKHRQEVIAAGIDPDDIGVHSIRKGAATYVCSGSTCCPSIAAVCNRAGWTMGKVKDIYIQYESAQDQYVGRVVAGLNVQSHEFAISPPYFLSCDEYFTVEDLAIDMQSVFPFPIVTSQRLLLNFCFASLLHGRDFLLSTWGCSSRGTSSSFRSNPILMSRPNNMLFLKSRKAIVVKYAWESDCMYLTGIPPHVVMFIKQMEIMKEVSKLHLLHMNKIETACKEAVTAIRSDLDSRSIGGGQISINRIESLLNPINTRVDNLSNRIELVLTGANLSTSTSSTSVAQSDSTRPTPRENFYWGNKWRRMPENYDINKKMTTIQAWQAWHHGDSTVGPLKYVEQVDICDSKPDGKGKLRPIRDGAVKTLWHLRYLCCALDTAAQLRAGVVPSIAELNVCFSSEAVASTLPSTSTSHLRERRTQELGWLTVAKLMREEETSASIRQRKRQRSIILHS